MAPSLNPFYGRGRNLRVLIIVLVLVLLFWQLRSPDGASLFHRHYEAPIRNKNVDAKKIAQGEYIVYLSKGHTMSRHMAAIGRDLKSHLRNQFTFGTSELTYSVIGVDAALLRAIRSDPLVKFVEHDLLEEEPTFRKKPKTPDREKAKAKAVLEEVKEEEKKKAGVKDEAEPVEHAMVKEQPAAAAKAAAEEVVKEQPA